MHNVTKVSENIFNGCFDVHNPNVGQKERVIAFTTNVLKGAPIGFKAEDDRVPLHLSMRRLSLPSALGERRCLSSQGLPNNYMKLKKKKVKG